MAAISSFDPAHTAILAMDCQAVIVSIYTSSGDGFIARAVSVLQAARAAQIPVIFVQVGFRPGFPEISPRNKLFDAIRSSPERQKLFTGPAGAIHPQLGPEPGDIVVTKHRVSAFTGTDLAMILHAREIDTLVLFGIATSGVVLSTFLDAFDADYRLIIISDCCADRDPVLHEALLTRLFAQRAEVITTAGFLEAVKSPTGSI